MLNWLHTPLSRLRYLLIGCLLAVVKVSIDYGVAQAFGRPYSVLFYVSPVDAPLFHMSDDRAYWQALAVAAVPFIAVGVALTVKRLHDAAMSPWFVLLFFVPFANLLFFASMALVPSRPRPLPLVLPDEAPYREPGVPPTAPAWPPARRYPRLLSGVFGMVIFLGTFGISVGLLKEYGVAMMLGSPTISGFATGAFYARLDPNGRFRGAAASVGIVIALSMAGSLSFAVEGLGCMVLFFPLFALPGIFGAYIGFAAARAVPPARVDTLIGMSVLSFFLLLGLERVSPLPPLVPPPVETSVEIDAPPERVWALLPSMDPMPPPEDWVFRYVRIAYPVRATLRGDGFGAKRTCEFTTGPALETVDVWSPGHVLGFTIDSQPDPMVELTLYQTVRQPHLDGYVRNVRGELVLEALPGGRTKLTGRSWYTVRIAPEFYARLWSDMFIHKIHERVLGVVKARAEGPGPRLLARGEP